MDADWVFSDKWFEMAERFFEVFPDADWGVEGCGITESEAIELIEKSLAENIDYLSTSYPEYPEGVVIA